MVNFWKNQWEPEMLRLADYNTSDAQELVEKLPKFAVVRHPLSRLVSTWRDKFGPDTKGDNVGEKQFFFVIDFQNYFVFDCKIF